MKCQASKEEYSKVIRSQIITNIGSYKNACNFVTEFVLTNRYLKQVNKTMGLNIDLQKRFKVSPQTSHTVINTVSEEFQNLLAEKKQSEISIDSLDYKSENNEFTIDIYDSIRLRAWKCLIDNNITKLPVDLFKIVQKFNIEVFYDSKVEILKSSERGRCLIINDRQVIILDDKLPREQIRHELAHELGHIILYPDHVNYKLWSLDKKEVKLTPEEERQVSMFAIHATAPLPLLRAEGINHSLQIANKCNIPPEIAIIVAQYIKAICVDEDIRLNAVEQSLYDELQINIDLLKR